jgi:hypothetical protein
VDGHDGEAEGAGPVGPPAGGGDPGPTAPPSPGELVAAASQQVRSRPVLTAGLAEGVHRRAEGGIAGAMAAVAGGLVGIGITVVALRGDPSSWVVALVGALLVVIGMAIGLSVRGWVAVSGWPVGPLTSAATVLALGGAGVLVVGIVGLATQDSSSSSIFWWPYLLLAGVLLALWLLPGVQGRPALLGAALLALVFAVTAFAAVQEVEDGLSASFPTEERFSAVGTAIGDEPSTLQDDDGFGFGYVDGYADGYSDGDLDDSDDLAYGDGYVGAVGGDDTYSLGYSDGYSDGYDDGFYGDDYDDGAGLGATEVYESDDSFGDIGSSPFGLLGVVGDAWTTSAWVALVLGMVLLLGSAVADHVGWLGVSTPMVFAGLVAAVTGGLGVSTDAGVLVHLALGAAALLVLGLGALAGRRATTWIAAAASAASVIALLGEVLEPGSGDAVVIGVAVLVAGLVAGGVAVALSLWVQPGIERYRWRRRIDAPPSEAPTTS